MRKFFALLAVVLIVASSATAFAASRGPLNATVAPLGTAGDTPARAPGGYARADTIVFGYYQVIGGSYYAVQGETWTWDHGAPSVTEGWYSVDGSANTGAFFRHITSAIWTADPNNPTPAPIIAGTGSAWLGLFESQARALCWDAGLGYGNKWCQRLNGPTLNYDGTGNVTIAFSYFNNSEPDFDYTKLLLKVGQNSTTLNDPGFTDVAGTPPTGPWASYSRDITNAEFGGNQTNFQVVFEFESDGGWSDQDGAYPTEWGPFGVDNVTLTNNLTGGNVSYNFDAGLTPWTATTCPAVGSFFHIAPLSQYNILDPCACSLAGNVAVFHDPNGLHPVGQLEGAYSPPANRTAFQSYNQISAYWDQYAEMPRANGVFYRPGWSYYPYICPSTGVAQWSGRQGRDGWFYVGTAPACYKTNDIASDWGIPSQCDLVGFVYEVYSSCDAFGIPSTQCTHVTNFTPVIDNVQIRMVGVPNAPVVSFETGMQYQDGFGQGLILSTTDAGNADATYDLHRDNPTNDLLGDSIVVKGPTITPTNKWLSKLWFRVRREGPGQASVAGYNTWKTKVADGLNIVGANGQWTYGWMDSVEVGTQIAKNKFCSQFSELDDDFTAPEQGPANEIIQDGILAPGTKIQYFITAAYICTPTEYYYLPDTSGKYYYSFEILPSFRNVGGVPKFPCVFYCDAAPGINNGAQFYIENALNVVLNGAGSGAPIPDPTTWDRYDYLDASSNWNAPLFRNIGGNAGASLPQMLGYKLMIVNTGTNPEGVMDTRDWNGISDWLSAVVCNSNANLQGFIGSGDNIASAISNHFPLLLSSYLGAFFNCDGYNQVGCPSGESENDEQYCTRLAYASGGPWQPSVPLDVWGNWCPPQFFFDVIGTTGGGVGNKRYQKIGPNVVASYAQVVNDASASASKYRTVVDGYSYDHLSRRDTNNPGPDTECPNDSASVITATYSEIREAVKWTLNISDPLSLGSLCVDPCGSNPGVEEGSASGPATMLYQNHPNPFNPRTSIKFSLATAGPAKLIIFDVNGRKVKTLVDGQQAAGPHEVVWDGTDDAGRTVASGIFWSQLSAGDYTSSKKMVVLK